MAKKKKEIDKDEESDGTIAVNDAWTGMLAISLIALVVATVFLFLDYNNYGEAPKHVPLAPPKMSPPPVVVEPKEKEKGQDKEAEKDAMPDKKGMP
jgi:hypothetical protein